MKTIATRLARTWAPPSSDQFRRMPRRGSMSVVAGEREERHAIADELERHRSAALARLLERTAVERRPRVDHPQRDRAAAPGPSNLDADGRGLAGPTDGRSAIGS